VSRAKLSNHRIITSIAITLLGSASLGAAKAPPPTAQPEKRCGWLVNPTPGNFELIDRAGAWLLSSQGGYQADGMDDMPDMSVAGWVSTNGSYGHGCACLKVVTNKRTKEVTRLLASEPLPLSRCKADRTLPKPE
jgi:hypothetical protein